MNQRRVPPDKIDTHGSGRVVDRGGEIDGSATRAFSQERHGSYRDALVGDANTELVPDLVDRADQPTRCAFDLFTHVLGGLFDRFGNAIAQTQAERYSANVEMIHLGHAHGLQDFGLGIFHWKVSSFGFPVSS